MIHVAKMRYPNMNFKVQPCYPLGWNDESIDIITVCCAFHHFDNSQGFVNECKRVLKKNGTVYIADPNFGAFLRFFANKFWFPISKSGDVRIYSSKELEAIFIILDLKQYRFIGRIRDCFLKLKSNNKFLLVGKQRDIVTL